jgi:hypothetical protein
MVRRPGLHLLGAPANRMCSRVGVDFVLVDGRLNPLTRQEQNVRL